MTNDEIEGRLIGLEAFAWSSMLFLMRQMQSHEQPEKAVEIMDSLRDAITAEVREQKLTDSARVAANNYADLLLGRLSEHLRTGI